MRKFLLSIIIGFTLLYADCVRDDNQKVVTCKDIEKTLMWQDDGGVRIKIKWQKAKEYCSKLDLGGYNNWRLPSLKELRGIVQRDRVKSAIKRAFKRTQLECYWTSTPSAIDESKAWVIVFKYGNDYWDDKDGYNFIRCVR